MTLKLLAALLSAIPASTSFAALTVYVSPNDIESAEDSGIVGVTFDQIFTETLNTRPLGSIDGYVSPTIGVAYTTASGGNVQVNDQYGGHNEGNYLGVAANSSTTLTLAGPSEYFGFYFTAGDAQNSITVSSGGTTLMTFSTATLIAMLPRGNGNVITAINGSQYATDNYYGKPVDGGNGNEPYAYLHFVAAGGTTFDRIVLSQGTTAIFENDNHSILAAAPVIPTSLVYVAGTPVPEPSSAGLALAALGLLYRRRR